MDIQNDDAEKEKMEIEEDQEKHGEEIMEVDEAAGSAEGLTDRDDHMLDESVKEDREETEANALDVPESDIIR
jgi:hypothetical protein